MNFVDKIKINIYFLLYMLKYYVTNVYVNFILKLFSIYNFIELLL